MSDPGNSGYPDPDQKVPVEAKVKASTVSAGALAAVILAVLGVVNTSDIVIGLPDWVPTLIGAAIAALGVFAAGHQTDHTPRPDLPLQER